MAELTLTGGEGCFQWTISGLGSSFTTANYKCVGITIYKFTQQASSINGIVDSIASGAGGTTVTSGWIKRDPGDYTFWGFAQAANGKYYPIQDSLDGVSVTVESGVTLPSIKSFSISTVDGTLSGDCEWSIGNADSGVTCEIRASTTRPSDYEDDGYQKGEYGWRITSDTISFNGANKYYVWLNLYYDGKYVETSITTFTPDLEKPSKWSWTSAETNAFNNKGKITALTQTRWNAFIAHVNLAISYYNEANSGNLTLIYDASKMGDDKILYAEDFTSVCGRINSLCWKFGVQDTAISSVSKGDAIMGSYFTTLSSALNRAINKF